MDEGEMEREQYCIAESTHNSYMYIVITSICTYGLANVLSSSLQKIVFLYGDSAHKKGRADPHLVNATGGLVGCSEGANGGGLLAWERR